MIRKLFEIRDTYEVLGFLRGIRFAGLLSLRFFGMVSSTCSSAAKYFLHQLKQEEIRFAFDEKVNCYHKQ